MIFKLWDSGTDQPENSEFGGSIHKDASRIKLTAGFIAKSIASRLFLPSSWPTLAQRLRQHRVRGKAADDASLKLYGQVLPGGFLNYGYHENPVLPPEKMCLEDIEKAQVRYGERLVAW